MTTALRTVPAPQAGGLLVNLGTPDAPTTGAVRRYLREFLSDPRVVDLPAALRWPLVNLVIAPFRARRSAAAYRRIWTPEGSPLRVYTEALLAAVRARLGPAMPVALAMRYGEPSIEAQFARLVAAGVQEIRVLPLYPQWAASTSGSVAARIYEIAGRAFDPHRVTVLPPFYDRAGFVEAIATRIEDVLDAAPVEALVLSYHGLPERHIHKSASPAGTCMLDDHCCTAPEADPPRCYRAQCLATTKAVVARLARPDLPAHTAFQSRLGRDPWLGPTTLDILSQLARQGVRHVAVACPSFVADCLETLEEIGIRATEHFRAEGGQALHLIPAVNDAAAFADTVADLLRGARADTAPVAGDLAPGPCR